MASRSNPRPPGIFLTGSGDNRAIGVLVLHGFLGSVESVRPWAEGVARAGFTVSAPNMAGHGTTWQELAHTNWHDWYESAEEELLKLQQVCDRVFIAGFSMGGAIALKLVENYGDQLEAAIVLNASIGDDRFIFKLIPFLKHILRSVKNGPTDVAQPNPPQHIYPRTPLAPLDSLRKLWKTVREDLEAVDIPLMVAYSQNDHTVSPVWSQLILESVYSPTVRELIFERSFHNVALDYDADELIKETVEFIQDVLSGQFDSMGEDDETDLINAEFDEIVSGLSLDESHPTTFLDDLDRAHSDDFIPPNPRIPPTDDIGRLAIALLIAGPAYLIIKALSGFSLFGFGVWPGVLSIIGGVAVWLYKFSSRIEDEGDDGAVV